MTFDVRAAAALLNEKNKAEAEALVLRRHEAAAEGERLAELIGSRDPVVRTVIGFGSVYEADRPFLDTSDIDLAVDGGDALLHFRLTETSAFHVDVVQIGGADDAFTRGIRERGRVLFSRARQGIDAGKS